MITGRDLLEIIGFSIATAVLAVVIAVGLVFALERTGLIAGSIACEEVYRG